MSITTVARTGHSHAFFGNIESNRTKFPFIPDALVSMSAPEAFEATVVNGPIFGAFCNMVQVSDLEPVSTLLVRMSADQLKQSIHGNAPVQLVMDALNKDNPGAGDAILEACHSQFLSWVS